MTPSGSATPGVLWRRLPLSRDAALSKCWASRKSAQEGEEAFYGGLASSLEEQRLYPAQTRSNGHSGEKPNGLGVPLPPSSFSIERAYARNN